MKIILINSLAIIAGFVLGSIVNMALVMTGPHLIPVPAGINVNDPKSLAEGMHLLEPKHFLFPFLAHALGTLAGAMTTHLVAASRRALLAWVIGGLFLLGGIAACFMIPAPAWFMAVDLLVAYLPMAWLGIKIGRNIRPEVSP